MANESKRRVAAHNGRKGKDGVYSAKHNDRNFDLDNADHIAQEKVSENRYWHRYQKNEPDLTFDEAEKKYYEETFGKSLEAKNERYRSQRHPERCQTMDQYRSSFRSCPEETLLYIGSKKFDVDTHILWNIMIGHINWIYTTFPGVKVLDAALHVDEEGAPHIHLRQVWVAHDKDGNLCVGQAKALEEMKIGAPDPDKPIGKHNNAKMTYTKMCREHLFELCESYGLDVEREPQDPSKSGQSLIDYKARQAEERAKEAETRAKEAKRTIDKAAGLDAGISEKEKKLHDLADTEKLVDTTLEEMDFSEFEKKKLREKPAEYAKKMVAKIAPAMIQTAKQQLRDEFEQEYAAREQAVSEREQNSEDYIRQEAIKLSGSAVKKADDARRAAEDKARKLEEDNKKLKKAVERLKTGVKYLFNALYDRIREGIAAFLYNEGIDELNEELDEWQKEQKDKYKTGDYGWTKDLEKGMFDYDDHEHNGHDGKDI